MIRLTKPLVGSEELEGIASVLESGFLARDPKVIEFENALADYLNLKHRAGWIALEGLGFFGPTAWLI